MGLALLYPTSSSAYEGKKFCCLQAEVDGYIKGKGMENSQENQERIFTPEDNKPKENNKVAEDWDDCVEDRKLQPEEEQKIAQDWDDCVEDRKLQQKITNND